jgi:hypothetical protein
LFGGRRRLGRRGAGCGGALAGRAQGGHLDDDLARAIPGQRRQLLDQVLAIAAAAIPRL